MKYSKLIFPFIIFFIIFIFFAFTHYFVYKTAYRTAYIDYQNELNQYLFKEAQYRKTIDSLKYKISQIELSLQKPYIPPRIPDDVKEIAKILDSLLK